MVVGCWNPDPGNFAVPVTSMSTASVNKWSAVKGQSGLDRCHAQSGIAHCRIHAREMRDWGHAHVVAAARFATAGRRIQRPLRALAAVAADPPLSAAPVSLCLGLATLPSERQSCAAPGAERRVLKSDDEWRSSRLGRRRHDRGTTSAKLSDPPSPTAAIDSHSARSPLRRSDSSLHCMSAGC